MNEIDMMQAILNELQGISSRLDRLENGQKALEDGQKALEDGQKLIRRDIARVKHRIGHLSDDMSDLIFLITDEMDNRKNNQ